MRHSECMKETGKLENSVITEAASVDIPVYQESPHEWQERWFWQAIQCGVLVALWQCWQFMKKWNSQTQIVIKVIDIQKVAMDIIRNSCDV